MAKVNGRGASAGTAAGIVCALSLVSGCGMVDTGVRVAGQTDSGTVSPAPRPSADPDRREARSIDAVTVLREDPGVSQDVKDIIAQPCTGSGGDGAGWFPVYTNYATLAGTDVRVALIDVQGCADTVACPGTRATYVYRLWDDRTKRVFAAEDSLSEVIAEGGELFVQRSSWQPGAPSACPSGGALIPLRWDGDKLVADDE